MRKAIVTKYLGPSNFRGSRVKATAPDNPALTIGYDSALDSAGAHAQAAKALAERMHWAGLWVGGAPPGSGYCFACLEGSFSREWVDKYICGKEDSDWFFVKPEVTA